MQRRDVAARHERRQPWRSRGGRRAAGTRTPHDQAPGPQPNDGGRREQLTEETHVGAVHSQITDLERSVEYYQGVLGRDVLERGAGPASLSACRKRANRQLHALRSSRPGLFVATVIRRTRSCRALSCGADPYRKRGACSRTRAASDRATPSELQTLQNETSRSK
jgi:hypothetical protein